ncbi:TfoX/Sxy family protein [Flexithrix dorotheae]|uniref:TfoX/Sxy family protein n=1 Tax=Flexithrix dorotheae TaxID=70993 RepID=UPI001B7FDDD7|nr:TfoX/Sxy family protein [Flexithrix dorotheae]
MEQKKSAMPVSEDYLNYIKDQLEGVGEVEIKRMFGGVGLFHGGLMFGKIGDDVFRLKVDETNQADYEARGMKPFYSETKKKGMPYWEVPADVIENKEELAKWVAKSFEVAERAGKKKK